MLVEPGLLHGRNKITHFIVSISIQGQSRACNTCFALQQALSLNCNIFKEIFTVIFWILHSLGLHSCMLYAFGMSWRRIGIWFQEVSWLHLARQRTWPTWFANELDWSNFKHFADVLKFMRWCNSEGYRSWLHPSWISICTVMSFRASILQY